MTKTFIRRIFLSFTLAISYYSVSMAIDGDYNPLLAKQAIATIKNLHITSLKDLINDRDNDDEINLSIVSKGSKGKEEVTEEKIPQDYELEKEKVLKNFLSSIDKSLYKEYFKEAFNNISVNYIRDQEREKKIVTYLLQWFDSQTDLQWFDSQADLINTFTDDELFKKIQDLYKELRDGLIYKAPESSVRIFVLKRIEMLKESESLYYPSFLNERMISNQVFKRNILEYIARLIIKGKPGYDSNKYGGDLGQSLYNQMQPQILFLLDQRCRSFKAEANNPANEDIKVFFNDLLNLMGTQRHWIAQLTETESSGKFGSRNWDNEDNPLMMDTMSSSYWKPWYSLIHAKVSEILKENDLDHDLKQLSSKCKQEKTTLQHKSLALDLFNIDGEIRGVLRHERDIYKPRDLRQAAIYHIRPFKSPTSFFDKMYRVSCYHRHFSSQVTDQGLEDFTNALYAKNDEELKQSLAGLLWKISHSSTFERGQAGITEWLLKVLAQINGYTLKFSDDWNPKKGEYASPDQHALAELDYQEFVNDSVLNGKIVLEKGTLLRGV